MLFLQTKSVKMSPDPPRGDPDSAEDLLHSEEVYFMPIDDLEDDFMADEHGPHELDFSDHDNNNSDFSDDEQNPQQPPQPVNVDPGQPRMMARYQLLIPMPPNEVVDTSVSEEIQPADQSQSTPVTTETKEEKKEGGGKKREIDLTDNQVELIKNAMKGFTLPASSIPQWAEEVDESKWKETLVSAIQKNVSSDSVKGSQDEPEPIPGAHSS